MNKHENQNFWYYEVEGKRFNNNVDTFIALKKARLKNRRAKPTFILDFKFIRNASKKLWQKEPEHPLSFYMDKHVRILSEKFKKIILFYSAGTDSHPIAQTFARCEVPVELLWWRSPEYSHIRSVEWENHVVPDLKIYFNKVNKIKKLLTYNETIQALPKEQDLANFIVDVYGTFDANKQPWNFPGKYESMEGGIPSNYKTKDTDCVIGGYEKPFIRLRQGWWWHCLADSTLTYCPDESTNFIWFYITDNVPELHVKCTWLKIKAIESILRREKLPFTDAQVMGMQHHASPYYKEINDQVGYISLNKWLSLPGNKPHADKRMADTIGFKAVEINEGIIKKRYQPIDKYWKEVVVTSVEGKYLNLKTKTITPIYTPLIPIKRVFA